MTRSTCRSLGLLFWIGTVIGVSIAVGSRDGGAKSAGKSSLIRYLAGLSESLEVIDPVSCLKKNDPLFWQCDDGTWKQIGYVSDLTVGNKENRVRIDWYAVEVSPQECELTQYRSDGSLEEVIETMLPPEKRQQLQQLLTATMRMHGDDLSAAFVPLVQESLRRSLPVIEEEFRVAVDRHRGDIDRLAERWNDEVVSERLIPLARKEIMPIVRKHGEPPVEQIGRELYDRASLWRFGWRALYDKSPLPRKDLLQQEWDRFVEVEAIPVFEDYMDDIVVAVQRIIGDVAANRNVRRELAEVAEGIAADPEARQLVRTILKETLIENQRLRDVWSSVWSGDDARQALEMAGDRLEPVVRQIGDQLFGTREAGIDPNFARVLRNQILGKDRRWIVARRTGQRASSINVAADSMTYPIVYMADAGDFRKDPGE